MTSPASFWGDAHALPTVNRKSISFLQTTSFKSVESVIYSSLCICHLSIIYVVVVVAAVVGGGGGNGDDSDSVGSDGG